MLRIPGSINSKNKAEVKVIQAWDGRRPDYRLLLGAFHIHLGTEKARKEEANKTQFYNNGSDNNNNNDINDFRYVFWIEKLLQTPIADNRKFVVDLILAPYLIVERKLDEQAAYQIIMQWLEKCNQVERLTFNASSRTIEKIRQAHRSQIPHMSWARLMERNPELCKLVEEKQ